MNKLEATKFVVDLAKAGSQRAAAQALGCAQSIISKRLGLARDALGVDKVQKLLDANRPAGSTPKVAAGAKSVNPTSELVIALQKGDKEAIDKRVLSDQLKMANAQLKKMAESALSNEMIRRTIFEISHHKPSSPAWLIAPKSAKAKHSAPGVPILFGSDWHWGEVVNPAEIGGVNKYNLEIAHQRLHKLIEGTISLLTEHMVNPQYPGIVFALGGDMVSGNIHEELVETNEMPIMPVVLDLVDQLIAAIKRLKSVFGKVFLPCVAGNHGRGHKKPRAKESNFSSYDWLIYQVLDKHFAADPDVVFYIPDGPDALISVYGHKYLFHHGNSFRGGDSMIGPLGPVIRGDHKKRGRNQQVGQEYDTLVIGHFHTLVQMQRVIMNGSLIGYNEYAYFNNFGFEQPQQALWITHPDRGITFSMPVHVGERGQKSGDQPWIKFHDAKTA
jgi:hypothetical protein